MACVDRDIVDKIGFINCSFLNKLKARDEFFCRGLDL